MKRVYLVTVSGERYDSSIDSRLLERFRDVVRAHETWAFPTSASVLIVTDRNAEELRDQFCTCIGNYCSLLVVDVTDNQIEGYLRENIWTWINDKQDIFRDKQAMLKKAEDDVEHAVRVRDALKVACLSPEDKLFVPALERLNDYYEEAMKKVVT